MKSENYMMLKQFQDSFDLNSKPPGKIRNQKDRIRKEMERNKLTGYLGGSSIERNPENRNIIKLTNLPSGTAGDCVYNDLFAKGLHKCTINCILSCTDYEYTTRHHSNLINFINDPANKSFEDWSYGVCYVDIFVRMSFEPFFVPQIVVNGVCEAILLFFPMGIFAIGTKPRILDSNMLSVMGSHPPRLEIFESQKINYLDLYNGGINDCGPTFGDKIKFTPLTK